MKYIITEQQKEKLIDTIQKYLDSHLTPYDGWESPKEYINELKNDGGEFFLFLTDSYGEGEHMWYSICNNQNLSEPLTEGTCPLVALPDAKYEALNAFFGDMWKPIFLEWFNYNTKLPIVKVDSLGW
jgi:hypothetical protein